MASRTLFDQLVDALNSRVPDGVVRAWAWIRIAREGQVRSEHFQEKFPDHEYILEIGSRIGVLYTRKSWVFSRRWPVGVSEKEILPSNTKTADGTYANLLYDNTMDLKKEKGECSDRPQTSTRSRRPRKDDAPVRERLRELTGPERTRYAFKHPRSKYCQEVIRAATAQAGRVYAQRYEKVTGRRYFPSLVNKNVEKFKVIAGWCAEQDLSPGDWYDYVAVLYKNGSKLKTFPSPAHCSGPWAMDSWMEDSAPKKHRHAGHTYEQVSGNIRERLKVAGFDISDYDDDILDWIASRARDKIRVPELYESDDDTRIEKIVDWLVAQES